MKYDVALALYFAFMLWFGWKRGFVKSVYSVVSLVLSVVMLYLFREPLAHMISQTKFGETVVTYFESFGVESVAQKCSNAVFFSVSSVALYVGLRFVMQFVMKVFNFLASLPLIKTLNSFLGMLLRGAEACIWILVFTNLLSVFPETGQLVEESLIVKMFGIVMI